jgi:hypothetical protein
MAADLVAKDQFDGPSELSSQRKATSSYDFAALA